MRYGRSGMMGGHTNIMFNKPSTLHGYGGKDLVGGKKCLKLIVLRIMKEE